MQPYYTIKLKCFMLQIVTGTAICITAICVLVSILEEYFRHYTASAKYAYPVGAGISAVLILMGLIILYQAFHFEERAFGRKTGKFELFREDMTEHHTVCSGNLIVTERFVLLFSRRLFRMCTVIPMDELTACFENPVYGTVEKPSEYRLKFYDKSYECHEIVLESSQAEDGHQAFELICGRIPWIIHEDPDHFLDLRISKKGRKTIEKEIDKRKYVAAHPEGTVRIPEEDVSVKKGLPAIKNLLHMKNNKNDKGADE